MICLHCKEGISQDHEKCPERKRQADLAKDLGLPESMRKLLAAGGQLCECMHRTYTDLAKIGVRSVVE